jgi:hypothetical protein
MKLLFYAISFLFTISCISAMKRKLEIVPLKSYMGNLPLELQGTIVKNVFNLVIHEDEKLKKCFDQKKLREYVLNVPMLLGIKCTQEFHRLQTMCRNEIGGKRFLAHEFFCLRREHRDIFIRMANRSGIKKFIEGNVDVDDFRTIKVMENEDIKKGLELMTVSKGKMLYYCILGGLAMMLQLLPMTLILPEMSEANFMERVAIHVSMGSFVSSFPVLLISGFFYDHGKGVVEKSYRG